jgi:hypothetical protein
VEKYIKKISETIDGFKFEKKKQSIDIFNNELNLCTNNTDFNNTILSKCLNDARQNNVKKAIRLFENINLYTDISKLNTKEIIFYDIYRQPIFAYLKYKINDFESALEITSEIMKTVQKIESECKVIVFFKIQQLHNIVRIHIKQNEYLKAINLNKILLDYLLFNKQFTYNDMSFSIIEEELKELKNSFVLQVFSELVYFFDFKKDNFNFFDLCFDDILCSKEKLDTDFLYIFYWLKIYKDLQNDLTLNESEFENFINYSKTLGSTFLLDSINRLIIIKSKNINEVLSST